MKTFMRPRYLSALLFTLMLAPSLVAAAVDPVNVLDNSFSPQNITVNPGDTVVWTNYGSLTHTIIADNGSFVSSSISPGVNFSYVFNTPGTYAYHDQSYGAAGGVGMAGTVTVAGAIGSGGSIVPTSVVTTTAPSSSNAAGLQSQAQALLAEISQLQAQIAAANGGATNVSTAAVSSGTAGATVASGASCPNIGRVLSLGSSGTDVSRLQVFLAQDPTVYPQGTVSGYFGLLTQAAVQRWQIKYNIVSSGTPSTTGFGVVGPRTAAAIALLCSTGSTTGSTTTTTTTAASQAPTVGGLLQVSPITGSAPLTVSVNTTVNTTDSCVGAVYVLNFGDGTQSTSIPTQSGNCQPVLQSFTHTYTTAGTYTLVLASGSHQTTASVTVTSSTTSSIPADSLHASITSGPSPLAVVFTGTVSSLASYGCTGSCADTISFGDGQIGLVQIPTTPGTWQTFVIDHTYATAGSYTAQLQSVTGANDGAAITITVTTPANQTGGSYGIVSLPLPTSSTLPVTQSANISLPACGAYQVNWGDSSSLTTGTGSCTAGGSTVLLTHSYSAAGSYVVSLADGNGNVQQTSSVTIQ